MLKTSNDIRIHFAPLQGYTDRVYRTVFQKLFDGVDYFYSPYVMVDRDKTIDGIHDIVPFQESLVPQILPGNLNELKVLVNAFSQLPYRKINVNMGCPYKMVTGKGRGAALMQNPTFAADIVNYFSENTSLELSLKMRSGLEEEEEIFRLLDGIPLNKVAEIIIHPRTARQLYKGNANVRVVKKCKMNYPKVPFVYNGDISSLQDFQMIRNILDDQNEWMLGRGLLHNPFLARQIKSNCANLDANYRKRLHQFMNVLLAEIISDSKDMGHALNRCKIQFSYLLEEFSEFKKQRKKIVKVKSINDLETILEEMNP